MICNFWLMFFAVAVKNVNFDPPFIAHTLNFFFKAMTATIITIVSLALAIVLGYMLLKAREANARLGEQVRLLGQEQARLRDQSLLVFKDAASQLLAQQGHAMKDANEQRLNDILNPFKNNLDALRATIEAYKSQQGRDTAALQQQIKDLSDVNRSVGKEARELTQALRGDSKVQGDWGELVLKQILDLSGLEEGVNYELQATRDGNGEILKNDQGARLRPDVIFNLPEGKRLVIDSKVSLTAYTDYVNADGEQQRQEALKRHLASVRKHVDELGQKTYQRWVKDSADFVMMFIPNEPAYLLAMSADNDLWAYAFQRQVVIVSPTHLISVVRLIDQLWSRDRQTKNALEIAQEAGKMYDKMAAFVADLQSADKALHSAQKAYDDAWKKLSNGTGNLLGRAQKIKAMGAKTTKQLPSADD